MSPRTRQRRRHIWAAISADPTMTVRALARLAGCWTRTVQADIDALTALGYIARPGRKRTGFRVLVKHGRGRIAR